MRTAILFAFLLFPFHLCAQAPEFSRLGVNEGLSQNSVYGLLQDRQGFLWIGTGDGLNRFDGKSFVQYRGSYNDSTGTGLSARIITGRIEEDSKERLWFGSNTGIIVFDKRVATFTNPVKFNPELQKFSEGIRVVAIDKHDRVWLTNDNNRLLVLDPASWSLKELLATSSYDKVNREGELSGDHYYYLNKDGLYRFNIYGKDHRRVLRISEPQMLRKTSTGKLVVHTKSNFQEFDPQHNTHRTYRLPANPYGISHTHMSVMQEWPEGVFYLNISPNGAARFDAIRNEVDHFQNQPADPSSISSNLVLGSYIDRSHNLWIATEGGGLNRLDLKPSRFHNFPAYSFNKNEAANLMVKSIFRNGSNILVGTFSQGLYILNAANGNFKRIEYPQLATVTSPSSINVLFRDHKGNLWMNVGHAIGILDTVTFQFSKLGFIKDEGKITRSNFAVYSIAEYYPGRFIIGSNYGLHRMDLNGGRIETYNIAADTIFRGHNQGMVVLGDGSILLGRIRDGYAKIRIAPDGTLKRLSSGFNNTGIRHFYHDVARNISWMASENGLIASKQDGSHRFYDERDGMSNSYVYSIIPENDSVLWLSTNRGLNKVRLSGDGAFPGIQVTSYLQVHGLQSNEFNTGAFHRDDAGTLYFGGVNGINWFRPGQVTNHDFDPQISLTGIRINEKHYNGATPVNYLRNITLPYNKNTIAISFAALEFSNAQGHVYEYMLEGSDNQWVYSGNTNEARYSNLPPGNYKFHIRAGNGDGVWSEQHLTLAVIITPPFWQTIWFKLLVWTAIALLIIITVRSYIRSRINKHIQELEKENAINQERVRISRDMHDELGTGLTKISLLTALGKQKGDKQHVIEEVYSTSRKLTEKMGEIIWTLSPQNDTLDSLVAYLKEHFSDTTEALGIDAHAEIPGSIPAKRISYHKKQHLLLVCKEALHNAIKHSAADHVLFTVEMADDMIVFSIKDNGKGMAHEPAPVNGKRNGIANMRWRMKQIGGDLDVESREGEGTAITWKAPV